jgi:hypothetical protein
VTGVDPVDSSEREQEIGKIPIYRYKDSEVAVGNSQTAIKEKKKKGRFSNLFHHPLDATEKGSYDEIQISPKEDAMCCICLSEYEDSDLICKLW